MSMLFWGLLLLFYLHLRGMKRSAEIIAFQSSESQFLTDLDCPHGALRDLASAQGRQYPALALAMILRKLYREGLREGSGAVAMLVNIGKLGARTLCASINDENSVSCERTLWALKQFNFLSLSICLERQIVERATECVKRSEPQIQRLAAELIQKSHLSQG